MPAAGPAAGVGPAGQRRAGEAAGRRSGPRGEAAGREESGPRYAGVMTPAVRERCREVAALAARRDGLEVAADWVELLERYTGRRGRTAEVAKGHRPAAFPHSHSRKHDG